MPFGGLANGAVTDASMPQTTNQSQQITVYVRRRTSRTVLNVLYLPIWRIIIRYSGG